MEAEEFNALFSACPVVRYTVQNSVHSVYVRTSSVPLNMNAFSYFIDTWSNADNVLNTDFELYDDLQDALDKNDKWTVCNYNDLGIGYPRDCRPSTTGVSPSWFMDPETTQPSKQGKFVEWNLWERLYDVKFEIYTGTTCPSLATFAVLNPPEPSRTYSRQISGMTSILSDVEWQSWYPDWVWQYDLTTDWMIIDLGVPTEIHGVVTQGRDQPQYDPEYTTSYKVEVCSTAVVAECTWTRLTDSTSNNAFTGNTDMATRVRQLFSSPVTAQKVRISPLTWNTYPSMRAGLLVAAPPPMRILNPDESSRSFSGAWRNQADHSDSKLDTAQGWGHQDTDLDNLWLEIELEEATEIYGTVTQGRSNYAQWVTTLNIQAADCSAASSCEWVHMVNAAGSDTFTGNSGYGGTQVQQMFSGPITAKKVRFLPLTWYSFPTMRAGLLVAAMPAAAAAGAPPPPPQLHNSPRW
jgi:hypothetical protein